MLQMKLVGIFGNGKKRECLLKLNNKYLTDDYLCVIIDDIKKTVLSVDVYEKYTQIVLMCTDGKNIASLDVTKCSSYKGQIKRVLQTVEKAIDLDRKGELYNEETVWNGSEHSVYSRSQCDTSRGRCRGRESKKEDGDRGGTDRVGSFNQESHQINGQRGDEATIRTGILYDARPVSPQEFSAALDRYKRENSNLFGKAVDKHAESEYSGMKCLLWDKGQAGVAVESSGNITSLFKSSNSGIKNFATVSCKEAIVKGGNKLDCYSMNHGFLPNKYMDAGMTPVCKIKFNREFAPDGWDFELMGEPDIVFMAYLGDNRLLHEDFEDYTDREVPYIQDTEDKDAYTLAAEYRDSVLEKSKNCLAGTSKDSILGIIDKRKESLKEFTGAVSGLLGDLTKKIRGGN